MALQYFDLTHVRRTHAFIIDESVAIMVKEILLY